MRSKKQATGAIEYKQLGVGFIIPDGWAGQETAAGYLIDSADESGIALLNACEAKNIAELQDLAHQGIYNEQGTELTLSGTLEPFGSEGVSGEFQGLLEGNPVKAYIIGLVSPQGAGILITAAASPHHYSAVYKGLATGIAETIRFSAPQND